MERKKKRLISIAETAKRLGVSPFQVKSYAEQGFIKSTIMNGRMVIDSVSIDNLLASQRELADFKERYNTHKEIFLARMQREVQDYVDCRLLRKEVDSLNEKNEVLVNINNELKKELKMAKSGKNKEEPVPETHSIKVDDPDLQISVRLTNILLANGLHTLGDITKYSYRQLQSMHGMGEKSLKEVIDILQRYGIQFSSIPD